MSQPSKSNVGSSTPDSTNSAKSCSWDLVYVAKASPIRSAAGRVVTPAATSEAPYSVRPVKNVAPSATASHSSAKTIPNRWPHLPSTGYSCSEASVEHSGQRTDSIW